MNEVYNIFQYCLYSEYEKYKKLSFSDFDNLENILKYGATIRKYDFSITYDDYLFYCYNHYCCILDKCLNTSSKQDLMNLRGEAHITSVYRCQDTFVRMYWVVQDAVYYYISKLNPQMHEINLMFKEFFKNKLKLTEYYGSQKEIFNFYTTPSCVYFRPLLLEYTEKYLDEIEFSPIFTMFLYPITLTNFGKENILGIIDVFGEKLYEYYTKNKMSLLRYHFTKYKIRNLDRMKKLKEDIKFISIESENKYRETKNIPKIGENWVEETLLYYKIKEDFPFLQVVQHARPDFLGQQHYDIYIPKIKLAIEYQGEQHFKPIEYFGGVEAFEKQNKRDERKSFISNKNNITLIYVSKGYNYNEIVNKINILK